ncbi:uncharacterized protein LOC125305863 [Alosa alosa]|nr:uncharacterized protein LOC125305863 [Alosa alosa]
MNSILCFSTLIFTINIRHVVADPSDFVFAVTGSTVSIYSQLQTSAHNPVIIWYHESPVGDIDMLCLFTQSSLSFERGRGTLPDASGKTSLTLWNSTMSDAGRYFATLHINRKRTHVSGSAQYLVVTDPSGPAMRLYRGADDLGSPLFFCEVTGAGANWSDPYWQIKANGSVSTLDGMTAKRIGADGVFTRWSIIRLNSTLAVTCLCHQKNGTRVLFSSNEVDTRNGATACDWLVFLSPPCLLLFLLTMAAAILWTRRLRRLRAA